MEFHPICEIFPLMSEEDYDALVQDIAANGLREAIWTHEGKIIDGRHRFRACRDTGTEPLFREWDRRGSLTAFVVSLNLHRRHLDASQRAMVAADMLPAFEAEARERQQHAAQRTNAARWGDESLVANLPQATAEPSEERVSAISREVTSSGLARDQAASVVGVSPRSVATAKRIREKRPDLAESVRRGDMTLHRAAKQAEIEGTQQIDAALGRESPDYEQAAAAHRFRRYYHERAKALAELVALEPERILHYFPDPDERSYIDATHLGVRRWLDRFDEALRDDQRPRLVAAQEESA